MSRRDQLAAAVVHRRHQLQLTQDELAARSGLKTRKTVAAVEAGEPVKRRTLGLLDTGLAWHPGDAEALLLQGKTPVPLDTGPRADFEIDHDDDEELAIAALTRLSWDTRVALIQEMRRRRSEAVDPKRLHAG